MSERWTTSDIPDLTGRTTIVTGANSGIGQAAAHELARAGAGVVLACRNMEKGEIAADAIRADVPAAALELAALDLASLASVQEFARGFQSRHDRLDLLVNNAGIMAPPRRTTADGFESQIGTNHLGHFALTARLLPVLLAVDPARPARVVTVSSEAHKMGKIDLDDLHGERRYRRWGAYGQSKLANLLFALELDRRAGDRLRSTAAHPGYAATNLQFASPPWHEALAMRVGNLVLAQSARDGAWPTLYAATADIPGGSFAGPGGLGGMRGAPQIVVPSARARDTEMARRLWERSEELAGVSFAALTG